MHIALAAFILGMAVPGSASPVAGGEQHVRRQAPRSYSMTLHNTARNDEGQHAKRAGTAAGKLPINNAMYGKAWSIPVEFGTPPQKVNALIRTDYPDMFVSEPCVVNCTDPVTGDTQSPAYDPKASSTFKDGNRFVNASFSLVGGGTGGKLFSDTVSLGAGGSRPDQQMFIEMVGDVSLDFLSGRAGIGAAFGLGWPKNNPEPIPGAMKYTETGDTRPFWKYMADEVWEKPEFSMYIAPHDMKVDAFWTQQPNSGQITFGGANPDMYTGEFNYVGAFNESSWAIPLEGIKVNGESIDISTSVENYNRPNSTNANASDPNAPLIDMSVDAYIWLVTVPNDVADRIYAKIPGAQQRNMSTIGGLGKNFMGPEDVHPASVPCDTNATISFTFNGKDYTMEPKHYLATLAPNACMSLVLGWRRGVLGTPFLQTTYTSFRSSPNQIGFASVSPTAGDMVQSGANEGSINPSSSAGQDKTPSGGASGGAAASGSASGAAASSAAHGNSAASAIYLSTASAVVAAAFAAYIL